MIPETLPLVFIIAIDRLKVAAGIAASQEKVLPFILADGRSSGGEKIDHSAAITYGYEFLEKFVQLPFRLPRMRAHNVAPFVEALVGKATTVSNAATSNSSTMPVLEDIVATDSLLVKQVLSRVAPVLGHNPRRLKQFLNLFRLRHYVLDSIGWRQSGAPTLSQLGKIVALEVRWPRLIEAVLRRPSLLVQLEKAAANGSTEASANSQASGSEGAAVDAWLRDELLSAFLAEGAESDRIGGLDLGAILGAALINADAELTATQRQTATGHMLIRRADGSTEERQFT
jgi:hypothetical protein